MHSCAQLQTPLLAVHFIDLYDKVYHKQEVHFLLYLTVHTVI